MQFEDEPAIVYVVDSAFRLRYCNAAWDRFALANRGSQLLRETQIGHSIMDITPAPLRRFYSTLFGGVLRSGDLAEHVYQCSSDEKFRLFQMQVTRTYDDRLPCLVVKNSLLLEQEHERGDFRDDSQALRQGNGLIMMCCHCRKTRLPNAVDSWVWIPDLVRSMPQGVSHGICLACFEIHYEVTLSHQGLNFRQ